jgi:hypothetical protein
MRIPIARVALGAAAVLGASSTCTRDRSGEPASAIGQDDLEGPGAVSEALSTVHCILNVHTDRGTVHFEGPNWLLASGEGLAQSALQVDIRVLRFVLPAMSTTTTEKPDASTVSTAVGYSMTERYGVEDFTQVTIATGRFQRVEAYPAFQRTIFEVRDASCVTPLGTGAAYRPIGVYFKVVDTVDVPLPDVGVYVFDSTCVGPTCIGQWGPPTAGGGLRDGGTGDAGRG